MQATIVKTFRPLQPVAVDTALLRTSAELSAHAIDRLEQACAQRRAVFLWITRPSEGVRNERRFAIGIINAQRIAHSDILYITTTCAVRAVSGL